jgi:3-oxoacyl-[acyl-carrier protein] reductase
VSGGSRGLGRALVDALVARDYRVATFSRGPSEHVERWRHHPAVLWQPLEATDYHAVAEFVRTAERHFGRLEGLINNAAIGATGILATMPVAEIDRAVDVNLKAQIYLTKLVVGRMLKHRSGSIVNVSSVNALRGHEGVAVYSATKGALDAMTRSLARELGPKGIRVNSVAPGYFASDMVAGLDETAIARITRRTPLGRLCTEGDVVGLVLFLLVDAAGVTGQTVAIDGGFTC